jgi:hypothetical protein
MQPKILLPSIVHARIPRLSLLKSLTHLELATLYYTSVGCNPSVRNRISKAGTGLDEACSVIISQDQNLQHPDLESTLP